MFLKQTCVMYKVKMSDINLIEWNLKGGSHLPFSGCITDTLKNCCKRGMKSCQFFLGNPKTSKRAKITLGDLENSKKIVERMDLKCFTHAPYIYNLCGSTKNLWYENKYETDKMETIVKSLEYEMDIIGKLGGGVVIHPGSYPDKKCGLTSITKILDRIEFKPHYNLLLENSAGQGTTLGGTIEELREMLKTHNSDNVGLCIDTAHLWGVGEYDISTMNGVERLFEKISTEVSVKKVKLFHINDSKSQYGSKKDQHEFIAKGNIWKRDQTSLQFLLKKLERYSIPFVLETSPEDFKEIYRYGFLN